MKILQMNMTILSDSDILGITQKNRYHPPPIYIGGGGG